MFGYKKKNNLRKGVVPKGSARPTVKTFLTFCSSHLIGDKKFLSRPSDHLKFLGVPLGLVEAWRVWFCSREKPRCWGLHVHGRHTLVEDLRPHHLDAGHDLLLVAHQCHPEPLDVPARRTHIETHTESCSDPLSGSRH